LNRYQILFGQYVEELSRAEAVTARWWQRLLDAESARGATPQQAEECVRLRWPVGRAGHPLVLAVYRKFYIACERINEIVGAAYARKIKEAAARGEGDWGAENLEAESATETWDDWGPEWEIDPPRFLVEMLFGRRDDLAELMTRMVFSPIGEEDDRSV
jgi:hypothetical protein